MDPQTRANRIFILFYLMSDELRERFSDLEKKSLVFLGFCRFAKKMKGKRIGHVFQPFQRFPVNFTQTLYVDYLRWASVGGFIKVNTERYSLCNFSDQGIQRLLTLYYPSLRTSTLQAAAHKLEVCIWEVMQEHEATSSSGWGQLFYMSEASVRKMC